MYPGDGSSDSRPDVSWEGYGRRPQIETKAAMDIAADSIFNLVVVSRFSLLLINVLRNINPDMNAKIVIPTAISNSKEPRLVNFEKNDAIFAFTFKIIALSINTFF